MLIRDCDSLSWLRCSRCSRTAAPTCRRRLPRPVKTVVVEVAPVADVGAVTGEIKARTEIRRGFPHRRQDARTAGRRRCDWRVKDTVLARLDDTNERNSVRIAESQVDVARAELKDAEGNEARQRELLATRVHHAGQL